MKSKVLASIALFAGVVATASAGSFEATPGICKGVDKEITRVKSELAQQPSSIQAEWLERQLKALQTKKSACGDKGHSTQ